MSKTRASCRDEASRTIRAFFDGRGFTEVETPVRVTAPAPEPHIDAIRCGNGRYFRTSPELEMKCLLADGMERIYQWGPCFRAGENGPLHRPEFTMLEWYRTDADYRDILDDTRGLFADLIPDNSLSYRGAHIDIRAPWEIITVRAAYERWAGWDPVAQFDPDRFDIDMAEKIEPALPRDRPVVLTDYPAEAAALARLKPDDPAAAERWELYIGGLELANAYSELCDADEQRARFDRWRTQRRAAGKDPYPENEAFMNALEKGLPPCAGIALGVDRLVMLLSDAESIDDL